MSIFAKFKVSYQTKDEPLEILTMSWCNVEPTLAVSTSNGLIRFFSEEGVEFKELSYASEKGAIAKSIAWRTRSRVLAIGWSNGVVTLRDIHKKNAQEDVECHSGNEINLLFWSPEGSRLVSADIAGVVSVWKTDHRSKLVNILLYNLRQNSFGYFEQEGISYDTYRLLSSCWELSARYYDSQKNFPTAPSLMFFGAKRGYLIGMGTKEKALFYASISEPDFFIFSLSWKQDTVNENQKKLREGSLYVLSTNSTIYVVDVLNSSKLSFVVSSKIELGTFPKDAIHRFLDLKGTTFVEWLPSIPAIASMKAPAEYIEIHNLKNNDKYKLAETSINGCYTTLRYSKKLLNLLVGTDQGIILIFSIAMEAENEGKQSKVLFNLVHSIGAQSGAKIMEIKYRDYYGKLVVSSFSQSGSGSSEHKTGESKIEYQECLCFLYNHLQFERGRALSGDIAAVQVDPYLVYIQRGASISFEIECQILVKGLSVTQTHLLVWNSYSYQVYKFKEKMAELYADVTVPIDCVEISPKFLIVCEKLSHHVTVKSLKAVDLYTIQIKEGQGSPTLTHFSNEKIVIGTSNQNILVYALNKAAATLVREAIDLKIACDYGKSPKRKHSCLSNMKEANYQLMVTFIRLSSDGKKLVFLCDKIKAEKNFGPCPALFVYSLELNIIFWHDFRAHLEPTTSAEPVFAAFDDFDTRIVSVELNASAKINHETRTSCILLYIDHNQATCLQAEVINMEREKSFLVGSKTPNLFFASQKTEYTNDESHLLSLKARPMKRFVDVERLIMKKPSQKQKICDFNFYMLNGEVDKAYQSLKHVKSENVWHTLGLTCLESKRNELVEACLTNMFNARGLWHYNSGSAGNKNSRIGLSILALHTEQYEKSIEFGKEHGNSDYVIEILLSMGRFQDAVEHCKKYDRMAMKPVHYKWAKFLEAKHDFEGAVIQYEKSGRFFEDIPRMFVRFGMVKELDNYVHTAIKTAKAKKCLNLVCPKVGSNIFEVDVGIYQKYIEGKECMQLVHWYGKYLESRSLFKRALELYREVEDIPSQVRVYLVSGELRRAAEVVSKTEVADETKKRYGHYLLGCKYMEIEQYENAVSYFKLACNYNSAVEAARKGKLTMELYAAARQGCPQVKIKGALYLLKEEEYEKAATLFGEAGKLSCALKLCFRHELYSLLENLTNKYCSGEFENHFDMDGNVSLSEGPASVNSTLEKCAEFYLEHARYQKAVELYVAAGKTQEGLKYCEKYNILIDQSLAEIMVPTSGRNKILNSWKRKEILEEVGAVCEAQKSFHLAARKYTEAGNRIQAVKCLIKSNDVDKILYYARQAKNIEVYILVGNYIQTLDWRTQPKLLKTLVNYYKKAKAFAKLSQFYYTCAHDEIITYRDFGRSLAALQQSLNYIDMELHRLQSKARAEMEETDGSEVKKVIHIKKEITSIIAEVDLFNIAEKDLASKNDNDAVEKFQSLLKKATAEGTTSSFIPLGILYGSLIETYSSQGKYEESLELLEQMVGRSILFAPYVRRELVDEICNELGAKKFPEPAFGGEPLEYEPAGTESDSDDEEVVQSLSTDGS
eukprot:maker-scaffold_11-snap-gene-11.29-mRNA-1 protein AED:0.01 eAED:0.04 QI:0/0/0/1/1/1/3/0/1566